MTQTDDILQFINELGLDPVQAALEGLAEPEDVGLPQDIKFLQIPYKRGGAGAITFWALLLEMKPMLEATTLNRLAHLGLIASKGKQIEKYFKSEILTAEESKPYVYMYLDNYPRSPLYFFTMGLLTDKECIERTLASEQPGVIHALYQEGVASVEEIMPTLLRLLQRDLAATEPKELFVLSTLDFYYQNIPPAARHLAVEVTKEYLEQQPQFIDICQRSGYLDA